MIFVNQNQV